MHEAKVHLMPVNYIQAIKNETGSKSKKMKKVEESNRNKISN
jgi:hypothetical protein